MAYVGDVGGVFRGADVRTRLEAMQFSCGPPKPVGRWYHHFIEENTNTRGSK